MADWQGLLLEPAGLGPATYPAWFTAIAQRLLNGARLVVAGQPHTLTEVEFYYYGGDHLDPFTHRDPVQRECGRWYFHRTRGVYRGGSFKGIDLTFGGPDALGGVLFRGLEKPDGTLVDGPSLLVDHLLATTNSREVAVLDSRIGTRLAWEPDNPVRLEWVDPPADRPLYTCGRVGLTLKRSRPGVTEPPRYVLRPYRYLTEPRRIAKGKALLVVGQRLQGRSPEEIRALTGSSRSVVDRYLADFEEGRRLADFGPFFGKELGPRDLCQMYGAWHAVYGERRA